MCQTKCARKLKKGSKVTQLREARRNIRLQRMAPPPASNENSHHLPIPQVMDKDAQNKLIMELAWKTIILMRKNKIIQQKIIDLKKETTEFVVNAMKNPEARKRYMAQLHAQAVAQAQQAAMERRSYITSVIIEEPEDE